jgi:hypothetical protein
MVFSEACLSRCLNPSELRQLRGVHASVARKPEAQLLQRLHLLMQVQQSSPHGKAGRFLSPLAADVLNAEMVIDASSSLFKTSGPAETTPPRKVRAAGTPERGETK